MKSKYYLSNREIEYLDDRKAFIKAHGKSYGYIVKSRLLKKYAKMENTMVFIKKRLDSRTLGKLMQSLK